MTLLFAQAFPTFPSKMTDNGQSKAALKSMLVSGSVVPALSDTVGGMVDLGAEAGDKPAQLPGTGSSPAKATLQNNSNNSNNNNNVVGVHYKIGRKIGEGSFGIIYEGKDSHPFSLIHTLFSIDF